jgi:hypothetical protein
VRLATEVDPSEKSPAKWLVEIRHLVASNAGISEETTERAVDPAVFAAVSGETSHPSADALTRLTTLPGVELAAMVK